MVLLDHPRQMSSEGLFGRFIGVHGLLQCRLLPSGRSEAVTKARALELAIVPVYQQKPLGPWTTVGIPRVVQQRFTGARGALEMLMRQCLLSQTNAKPPYMLSLSLPGMILVSLVQLVLLLLLLLLVHMIHVSFVQVVIIHD